MEQIAKQTGAALVGLALRQGLAIVLFAWAYDFHFNGHYYARIFGEMPGGASLVGPAMVIQFGLALLLTTGLATRVAAAGAVALFAAYGLLQTDHQPIGMAQNFGLIGSAVALWFVGPGALAFRPNVVMPTGESVFRAQVALHVGLALTFLIYGIEKFTEILEYQIVVGEIVLFASLVGFVGAEKMVIALGVVEILLGVALLVPRLAMWGAIGQTAILLGILISIGYPFSYPQDLGLLAALGSAILTLQIYEQAELGTATRRETRQSVRRSPVSAPLPQPTTSA